MVELRLNAPPQSNNAPRKPQVLVSRPEVNRIRFGEDPSVRFRFGKLIDFGSATGKNRRLAEFSALQKIISCLSKTHCRCRRFVSPRRNGLDVEMFAQ
jgi:hypothetical protein